MAFHHGIAAAFSDGAKGRPEVVGLGPHAVLGLKLRRRIEALDNMQVVTPSFEEQQGRLAAQARQKAQAELLQSLRTRIPVEVRRPATAGGPG